MAIIDGGGMGAKLRVFMICSQYPISRGQKPTVGGGGAHAYYLCRALGGLEDVRVTLATHAYAHPGTELPAFRLYQANFKRSRKILTEEFVAAARRFGATVIHGHHYDGGLIGRAVAQELGVPFVLTMHKPPRLTRVRRDYFLSDADHARWRELALSPDVAANIAYSKTYMQELRRMSAPNPHMIYHGIPIDFIRKRAYSFR